MELMYFLSKISGRYYFRRRIPEDLSDYFLFREIKKNFKPSFKSYAKISVILIAVETERVFTLIRSRMLTDSQIKGLIKQFIDETLKNCENNRACGYGLPEDMDALDDAIAVYEAQLSEFREALSFNQTKPVEYLVTHLIERHSLAVEKQSEDYVKLSREVLKSVIEVMQIEKERLKGNYENPYDRMLTLSPITSPFIPKEEKPYKSLASVIDEYSREKISKKAWQGKTLAENAGIYRLLLGILNDILNIDTEDVKVLDRSIMIQYSEVLSKLPANMKKKKALRYMSLKKIYEILLKKPIKPMSTRSYNKHLERVSAMLKWASKQGYVERNPAESLTVKKEDRVASEEMDAYSKEDLEKLFL